MRCKQEQDYAERYRNFTYPIMCSTSPSPVKTSVCALSTERYWRKAARQDKAIKLGNSTFIFYIYIYNNNWLQTVRNGEHFFFLMML